MQRSVLACTSYNKPTLGDNDMPDFIAIDIETTGLDIHTSSMIELALVDGSPGSFYSMVRPRILRIPGNSKALSINQIDLREMHNWPSQGEVIDRACQWVESRTIAPRHLVGFNIGKFDYQFLPEKLRTLFSHRVVNLTSIGLVRGESAKSVDLIARYTGIDTSEGHRALLDATAAWHTFQAMRQSLGLRGTTTYRCLSAGLVPGLSKEELLDALAKHFDQRVAAKELFHNLNKDALVTLLEALKRR